MCFTSNIQIYPKTSLNFPSSPFEIFREKNEKRENRSLVILTKNSNRLDGKFELVFTSIGK